MSIGPHGPFSLERPVVDANFKTALVSQLSRAALRQKITPWIALLLTSASYALTKPAESWDSVDRAVQPFLEKQVESLPFSFRYGGTSSRDFLAGWKQIREAKEVDPQHTKVTMKFTDPATQLEVRAEAVIYRDFPAAEWVLWFRNGSEKPSPLLEDVNPLELRLPTSAEADPILDVNYNRGTNVKGEGLPGADEFQPAQVSLRPQNRCRFVPYGGRPSDKVLPFFRLDSPGGKSGLFWGIGWTGEWAATFARNEAGTTSVSAGIRQMKASLQPGEEIRTPSILVMAWHGKDTDEAHNQFRRLMLEHFTPQIGGKPVVPPISAGVHGVIPFEKTTESNLLECLANISAHKLPVENFWVDAGWYTCPPEPSGWDKTTGSWTPDPVRFPNGLRPIAETAKRQGLDFLLWFEPERVMPKTWLADNHPEWLLEPADFLPERKYQKASNFRLLDFGNPAALAWAKEYFSKFVRDQGVTIFRMDSNLHTILFWQNQEPPDRIGMRETRHVMGLYDFWDTLVSENPGLKLDICSGTGSRIDFEVMRRAMVLTRADGAWWKPVADQAKSLGHAPWTPYTGIGTVSDTSYDFRSGMGAIFGANFNYLSKNEADWDRWKKLLAQVKDLRKVYCGDFYPLTEWSLAEEDMAAWEFSRPDLGKALVQVFRRSKTETASEGYRLQLRGLEPKATYTVTDVDKPAVPSRMSGEELMKGGLTISFSQKPQAVLLILQKDPSDSGADQKRN